MRLEYFQMIDSVEAFDGAAQTLAARSTVPGSSPVFEGHFPGHPLVPGVLLIETMAQASGYLIMALKDFSAMPFLAGVRGGKLRSFVAPRAVLDIAVELVHDGSGFAVTSAAITSAGRRTCDAELTFRTLPFPAPELEAVMRREAERMGLVRQEDTPA